MDRDPIERFAQVLGDDDFLAWCRRVLLRNPKKHDQVMRRIQSKLRKAGYDPGDLPVVPPPTADKLDGDILLGKEYLTDRTVGLRSDQPTNIAIFGESGSGKTTCAMRIVFGLIALGISYRVVDFVKAFTPLSQAFPNTVVLDEPFENVLNPPSGVPLKDWLLAVLEIFEPEFGLMIGARGKLFSILVNDLLAHRSGAPPSLEEFRNHLKFLCFQRKIDHTTRGYIERSLPRFESLCMEMPQSSKMRRGILDGLYNTNIIYDLSGYPSQSRGFLATVLFLREYLYRLHNPNARTSVRFWIQDEAAATYSNRFERLHHQVVHPILTAIRQTRNMGLLVVGVSQEPSRIAHAFKANCPTKILFRIEDGEDLADVGRSLSLTREEVKEINQLERGVAIIRFGERSVTAKVKIDGSGLK